MKRLDLMAKKPLYTLVCLFTTLLVMICDQRAFGVNRIDVLETVNGKVVIKLEPHGTVRAKVFNGQQLQYEFILDRESQQNLLTQRISKANIYLVGNQCKELIIDDLKTGKRYILSIFSKTGKFRNLPPAQSQTIVVKGYSTTLLW